MALERMNINLQESYSLVRGDEAGELEHKINELRDVLRLEHTESIKNNAYSYQSGIFYMNIIAQMEKLGDYVINVTEAITGKKNV